MIVESAQLLSTAHYILDSSLEGYKPALVNHPSNKWARDSSQQYDWLYQLFYCLAQEYSYRYGKVHSTFERYGHFLSKAPNGCPDAGFTQPPQAMPDLYKVPGNSVEAYRRFYIAEKFRFAKWKNRSVPAWFNFAVWAELSPGDRADCVAFMSNPKNVNKTDLNGLFMVYNNRDL